MAHGLIQISVSMESYLIRQLEALISASISSNQEPTDKARNETRAEAWAKFKRSGLPDKKNEAYKYTDIRKLFAGRCEIAIDNPNETFTVPENLPEIDAVRIYTVNGLIKNIEGLIEEGKIIYGSIRAVANEMPSFFAEHYNKVASGYDDALLLLNTAAIGGGIFIYVPEGVKAEKPFLIVNTVTSECNAYVAQRNLSIFGKNAGATLIVLNKFVSKFDMICNTVNEIIIENNAEVDIIRLQNAGKNISVISNDCIVQRSDSKLSRTDLALRGNIIRNNVNISLDGKRCVVGLNGLVVGAGNSRIDNHVDINHIMPESESNQLYKSILSGKSVSVFDGAIKVNKDAQKTTALQNNKNIIVGREAKAYSKPRLEIYADDVKCSHGATMGQLDDNALFYMRSRGIGMRKAQSLLTAGFAIETLKDVKIPELRDYLTDEIEQTLSQDEQNEINAY